MMYEQPTIFLPEGMMKFFGRLLIFIGVVSLFFVFNSDVSVSNGINGRVANLELMNNRQNNVIISCFIILYGLLVSLFSHKVGKMKQCHQCSEDIKYEARKCRYCGSDVELKLK